MCSSWSNICMQIIACSKIKLTSCVTLLLLVMHICINFSTVYNDTLVAKGLTKTFHLQSEVHSNSLLRHRAFHFIVSLLGIQSVAEFERQIEMVGHLEPKSEEDWVRVCRYVKVAGDKGRGRGRGRKT